MEKNELLEKVDALKEIFGADDLLESVCRAMSSDDLESNLRYICRMNDINFNKPL